MILNQVRVKLNLIHKPQKLTKKHQLQMTQATTKRQTNNLSIAHYLKTFKPVKKLLKTKMLPAK